MNIIIERAGKKYKLIPITEEETRTCQDCGAKLEPGEGVERGRYGENHYCSKCAKNHEDEINMDENTVKVKGGYENIGKKGKHSKKPMTKKKADDQRKAMFAHRKPGASWGKS